MNRTAKCLDEVLLHHGQSLSGDSVVASVAKYVQGRSGYRIALLQERLLRHAHHLSPQDPLTVARAAPSAEVVSEASVPAGRGTGPRRGQGLSGLMEKSDLVDRPVDDPNLRSDDIRHGA